MVQDFSNKSERLKNKSTAKAQKPLNQTLVAFLVAVAIFGGTWLIWQYKNKTATQAPQVPVVQAEIEKEPQITLDVELPKRS